jgi:hypothetical protein
MVYEGSSISPPGSSSKVPPGEGMAFVVRVAFPLLDLTATDFARVKLGGHEACDDEILP